MRPVSSSVEKMLKTVIYNSSSPPSPVTTSSPGCQGGELASSPPNRISIRELESTPDLASSPEASSTPILPSSPEPYPHLRHTDTPTPTPCPDHVSKRESVWSFGLVAPGSAFSVLRTQGDAARQKRRGWRETTWYDDGEDSEHDEAGAAEAR
jgi:hypothetical protein